MAPNMNFHLGRIGEEGILEMIMVKMMTKWIIPKVTVWMMILAFYKDHVQAVTGESTFNFNISPIDGNHPKSQLISCFFQT